MKNIYYKDMKQYIRIILWWMCLLFLLLSIACMAFQIGKNAGINQAYEEIASQNIMLVHPSWHMEQ